MDDIELYGKFPRKDVISGVMLHYRICSAQARYHGGLFMQRGPLRGRDWLRRLSAEDRKVFSDLGRQHAPADLPSLGGQARAKNAARNAKGRFIKKEVHDATGIA